MLCRWISFNQRHTHIDFGIASVLCNRVNVTDQKTFSFNHLSSLTSYTLLDPCFTNTSTNACWAAKHRNVWNDAQGIYSISVWCSDKLQEHCWRGIFHSIFIYYYINELYILNQNQDGFLYGFLRSVERDQKGKLKQQN